MTAQFFPGTKLLLLLQGGFRRRRDGVRLVLRIAGPERGALLGGEAALGGRLFGVRASEAAHPEVGPLLWPQGRVQRPQLGGVLQEVSRPVWLFNDVSVVLIS